MKLPGVAGVSENNTIGSLRNEIRMEAQEVP